MSYMDKHLKLISVAILLICYTHFTLTHFTLTIGEQNVWTPPFGRRCRSRADSRQILDSRVHSSLVVACHSRVGRTLEYATPG